MILKVMYGKPKKQMSAGHAARYATALTQYLLDAQVDRLVDYVSDSDIHHHGRVGEKVERYGQRNLVGDRALWNIQMAASAASCTSSKKNPITHLTISVREGERFEDPDKLVADLMRFLCSDRSRETGPKDATRLPVVWAEHVNTKNRHIHVLISRVDPATRRPV